MVWACRSDLAWTLWASHGCLYTLLGQTLGSGWGWGCSPGRTEVFGSRLDLVGQEPGCSSPQSYGQKEGRVRQAHVIKSLKVKDIFVSLTFNARKSLLKQVFFFKFLILSNLIEASHFIAFRYVTYNFISTTAATITNLTTITTTTFVLILLKIVFHVTQQIYKYSDFLMKSLYSFFFLQCELVGITLKRNTNRS